MNYNAIREALHDAHIISGQQSTSNESSSISNTPKAHGHKPSLRSKKHLDAVLEWRGEWVCEGRDSLGRKQPHKLIYGDQHPLSKEEREALRGTVMEIGYQVYIYEGEVRPQNPGHEENQESLSDSSETKKGDMSLKDPRMWLRDGHGVLKYSEGDTYDGEWKMNKKHGLGSMRLLNGYRYVGEWKEDTMHGTGREIFGRSWDLVGCFDQGKSCGQGTLWYKPAERSTYHYEGNFQGGMKHGSGIIFYSNGDIFQGTWEAGKREGIGWHYLSSGEQYTSQWKADELVDTLRLVRDGDRKEPPVPQAKYEKPNCVALQPADLTRWKVHTDCHELPLELFHRLRLGFDALDTNNSGSLDLFQLRSIWPLNNVEMLNRLDRNSDRKLTLEEMLCYWYPNVPASEFSRLMRHFVPLRDLFRLRGILSGLRHANNYRYDSSCGGPVACWSIPGVARCPACGYDVEQHRNDPNGQVIAPSKGLSYVGGQGYLALNGIYAEPSSDVRMPLSALENAAPPFTIGSERFTLSMFHQACQPDALPSFLDILEAFYPHVSSEMLRFNLLRTISGVKSQVCALAADFRKRCRKEDENGECCLDLRDFHRAAESLRASEKDKCTLDTFEAELASHCYRGIFRSLLLWNFGPVPVSICMLEEMARLYGSPTSPDSNESKEWITWPAFLRFLFPNVPCARTRCALGEVTMLDSTRTSTSPGLSPSARNAGNCSPRAFQKLAPPAQHDSCVCVICTAKLTEYV